MQDLNNHPLSPLAVVIGELTHTFKALYQAIDDQIDAIVRQDAQRIEDLTDRHAGLHSQFRRQEKAFLDELKHCTPAGMATETGYSLTLLKEVYPEYATQLVEWQDDMARSIKWLQRHQQQLVQLLEFAQRQNSTLMRSMYTIENAKSVHYSHTGTKNAFTPGMAVNQEI
jgi:Mg2+ and Co2+ transporter CorA